MKIAWRNEHEVYLASEFGFAWFVSVRILHLGMLHILTCGTLIAVSSVQVIPRVCLSKICHPSNDKQNRRTKCWDVYD